MALIALDHVQIAMPAGGENAARCFYGEGLGTVEIAKPANLARRGGGGFRSGTIQVHLGVEAEFRPARKAHPAFETDGLDDLEKRLAGWRRIYVDDPFGNRVELTQRA